MPGSATQMYAKNLHTLIKHLAPDGTLTLDFDDEITKGATITHDGKVVNEATAKALGIEVAPPASGPAQPATDAPVADATASASAQTKDA
jgi:NAD(P) transhydrogenase subunit alpha